MKDREEEEEGYDPSSLSGPIGVRRVCLVLCAIYLFSAIKVRFLRIFIFIVRACVPGVPVLSRATRNALLNAKRRWKT